MPPTLNNLTEARQVYADPRHELPPEAKVISRGPSDDEHATELDTSGSAISILSATLAGFITGLADPLRANNSGAETQAVIAESDMPASALATAHFAGFSPDITIANVVEMIHRQPVLCLDAADTLCCLLLRQEPASACCAPASGCALLLTCCLVCFEGFDRTPDDAVLRDQACTTIWRQSTQCKLTRGSLQEACALASCRDGGPLGQYGGRRDRLCCPTYRDGELLGGTPPFNESSAELDEMMGKNSGTLQSLGPCCIASTP